MNETAFNNEQQHSQKTNDDRTNKQEEGERTPPGQHQRKGNTNRVGIPPAERYNNREETRNQREHNNRRGRIRLLTRKTSSGNDEETANDNRRGRTTRHPASGIKD